ncbi:MAG: di-trans,poly-cis-decaprenylcistransferase [Patescibacteria group bacterium]|nr:di-trans,poly-cis-decaprenylcistransferase [Patescibacteria group bacterium]
MNHDLTIRSVGIIMDGNRRWARERGLPTLEGHRKGLEALRALAKDFPVLHKKYGLTHAYLFAFSTENWQRKAEEVAYLMELFGAGLSEIIATTGEDPATAIRVKIIGERERFSPRLQKLMREAEEKTAHHRGGTAVFCLSYGGRAEIVDAINRCIAEGVPVDEQSFSNRLWTGGMPDPDLIIRTSGEERLSGFLPWQGVYSELFFTKTYWPDFTTTELENIFAEYAERERRHGK